MYFRRIGEAAKPTYAATNSSGQFMATIRKADDAKPDSWLVATGPDRREEVKGENMTLEDALEFAMRLEMG